MQSHSVEEDRMILVSVQKGFIENILAVVGELDSGPLVGISTAIM